MTLLWMPLIPLLFSLWIGQADPQPAYVREGDRVEAQLRAYRDRLDRFYAALGNLVDQRAPALRPLLQGATPSAPAVYGYQLLPRITGNADSDAPPVSMFSYSWPITQGYVEGETTKLEQSESQLPGVATAEEIARSIADYKELLRNQRTIDQYFEYNRFWQRTIAADRPRFDRLTALYDLMKSGEPSTSAAIREALGKPGVPSFVKVVQKGSGRISIQLPVYTDIEDEAFLSKTKDAVEAMWQAAESGITYSLAIDFRTIPSLQLYRTGAVPARGTHIDLNAHAALFPADGAVLTTGAESTHTVVGRYLALGPGDISIRTLAHEFGHLLGFHDGYIRGYRDLGAQGFEILELTSGFDDIMSAPREGHVQAAHFKLILEGRSLPRP